MARHTKFKLLPKLVTICIGPLVHGRSLTGFKINENGRNGHNFVLSVNGNLEINFTIVQGE